MEDHALHTARGLGELGRRAIAAGVAHALDAPLEVILDRPELTQGGAEALAALRRRGKCPTIATLVHDYSATEFLRGQADPKARQEIVLAVAGYLATFLRSPKSGAKPGPAKALDMTMGELRAWAEAQGIGPWLEASPYRVYQRARGYEYTSAHRTIFDVAMRGTTGLRRAAISFLEDVAAEARAGIAEERARPAQTPPDEPALRVLWDRLLTARQAARAAAAPRPARTVESEPITFRRDPPIVSYTEVSRVHGYDAGHVDLFLGEPDGLVRPQCRCGAGGWCTHALSALDALLAVLVRPDQLVFAREIARHAALRPWMRALDEVDALLGAVDAAAEGDDRQLGWRLRVRNGQALLMPVVEKRKKNGQPGRAAELKLEALLNQPELARLPADRAVCALLVPDADACRGHNQYQPRWLVHRALAALVGHPRVQLGAQATARLDVRAAQLSLVVEPRAGGDVELVPALDGAPIPPDEIVHGVGGGVLVMIDDAALVVRVAEVDERLRALCATLVKRGSVFPAESVTALGDRLPALSRLTTVTAPAALRGEVVAAAPRLIVRLTPAATGLSVEALVRVIPEALAYRPGVGPVDVLARRGPTRVTAQRDLADEPAWARARLASLPLPEDASFCWTLDNPDVALDLVDALATLADAIETEWPAGQRHRVTREAAPTDLRIDVSDRRDWFGLAGGIEVDGQAVPLAELLEAIRGGRRYVTVDGGTFVRISAALRAQLADAAEVVFAGRKGLEVSAVGARAVAALAEGGAQVVAPLRWQDLVGRIRAAGQIAPPAPPALTAALRDYQLDGFQWLSRLAAWGMGGCLADDMGLGKTVQALALLVRRASDGPALVVAPTSVCWNWIREAQRFAPSLRPVDYRVGRAAALAGAGPGDLVVVSYGLLARDVEELAKQRFATVVFDEAQAIKNPATRRARAANALQADFRLALTGTPLENRLGELWSLFRTIAPGLLGSWEQFRARFAAPIERNGDPERRAALARLVRPFLLRRMKAEVARELPARTEIQVDVALAPAARARYDAVRLAMVAELTRTRDGGLRPEQRRVQVLAALTRLRQLACHPRLFDKTSALPSAKLERFAELVRELRAEGHRALVFSQFTQFLALAREVLDAEQVPYLYLDGQTPEPRRRELVDAFQAGTGDLFLISLKAGGAGLNLTGADNVIHLDPWWNPAVEDQATDRAHRIGQTRPVTVYRLVTRGTIEDAILAMHEEKRGLIAGVLEGTGGATTMTADDLLALLSTNGAAEAVGFEDEPDELEVGP